MECPGLYYRGCSFIIYSINADTKNLLNAKSQRDRYVRFLVCFCFYCSREAFSVKGADRY